jgi:hypothetical protein
MESIDCVYYINLEHRTDRRQQIEETLDALHVPAEKRVRIPGIYTEGFGILGCGLSHKLALETFLASSHSTCLILEDDFQATLDQNYCSYLLRSIFDQKVEFDVVMLAGKIFKEETTHWPFLRKVLDGQTASAFLITREFASKLVDCLGESTVLLKEWHDKTGERKHEYCNDIYWKKLQPEARWYITVPKLGLQRESYSDNEARVTNYGV